MDLRAVDGPVVPVDVLTNPIAYKQLLRRATQPLRCQLSKCQLSYCSCLLLLLNRVGLQLRHVLFHPQQGRTVSA